MSDIVQIIKEAQKQGKIIYGKNKVLKSLLRGELEKVIVAKNCPWQIKEDVKRYAELSKIEYYEVNLDNMQLGVLIGRSHSVAVLGIKR